MMELDIFFWGEAQKSQNIRECRTAFSHEVAMPRTSEGSTDNGSHVKTIEANLERHEARP